jgi:hypothetical protein
MKIVSCFSRLSEIAPLAAAGADELYCAVADIPSYGHGALRGGLRAAAKAAHARGLKLSLAVNSLRLPYSKKQMAEFAGRLERAAGDGVDSFIVASPSVFTLFQELKRPLPVPVHLSSVQPCFNSRAARYFIRLGVSRLILPNQLSAQEAAEIFRECRAAGVETEIFDYRFFGCVYVNGRCNLHDPIFHTFTHGKEGDGLCRCGGPGAKLNVKASEVAPGRAAETPALARRLYARMTCGGPPRLANAASFFDFFAMGTNYLKYGTRKDPSGVKIRKVEELRAMLDLAESLTGKLPPKAARAAFISRMTGWRGGGF